MNVGADRRRRLALPVLAAAAALLASEPRAEEARAAGAADPPTSSVLGGPPGDAEPEPCAGRSTVAVGPEGMLSTLRVLALAPARLDAEAEAGLADFCEETDAGCRRPPQVWAAPDEGLDLEAIAGRRRVAYLGGRLLAPEATRVHLLVGVRGVLTVLLDGVEVLRHESSRLRHDDAVARLELSPGDHALVLRFERPGRGGWRARLRVLDGRFRPGTGPARLAVGALDDEAARGLARRALRLDEVRRAGEAGPEVRLRVWLPGGAVARPVALRLGEDEHRLEPRESVHDGSAELAVPMPARGDLTTAVELEGERRPVGRRLGSDRALLAARAALASMADRAPEATRGPLAWRIAELDRLVAEADPDALWRRTMTQEARRLATAVGRGEDPFAAPRGYARMGFVSRLDGTAQGYELFVPPGYSPGDDRQWPLVVTLHGLTGNAGNYFRNTFGLLRDHAGGETLLGHGRHGAPPTRGPMFVVAPTGRGRAMYRHMGEADVLEVLADVRRRFRIDPLRIYVTGGSMGGTGAAYLPYRHPDLFAASAALAGYHDQRVRRDTRHEGLSEVERSLQAERSDVDWAENGLHLPTLLVRGTMDPPLEWTRSLARRLRELGYPFEHREPEARHNVWNMTYADGAIFRHFARYRRPMEPREVRLRTARERTRQAYWVRVDAREAPDRFADVHATVAEDGTITARTDGVHALTLSPSTGLVPDGPLRVEIDGNTVEGERPLTLHRTAEGRWACAPFAYPRPGHKRPGASGPMRDPFHDPLVFVVGTADPDHTLVNRLVARHWARPRHIEVHYPIVDDTEVTDEMAREASLVLLGPPGSNLLTARWADRLPVRFDRNAVVVGSRRYEGEQVGAAFVAPSPAAEDRSLLVLAGPQPLGTWRALFLPDILADYAVFDEGIAPARDEWSAGGSGARYLEAGLFGMDWSVPSARP